MTSLCLLSRLYLKEEHKAKKGRELDSTKWTLGSLRATVSPAEFDVKYHMGLSFHFHYKINDLCNISTRVGGSPAEEW